MFGEYLFGYPLFDQDTFVSSPAILVVTHTVIGDGVWQPPIYIGAGILSISHELIGVGIAPGVSIVKVVDTLSIGMFLVSTQALGTSMVDSLSIGTFYVDLGEML